jgi:hypothetical protein
VICPVPNAWCSYAIPTFRNEFPPLRTSNTVRSHNLPAQLTSFVGRHGEMAEVRQIVTENRLVTLSGAGGAGKTRLAVEVAAQLTTDFEDGLCLELVSQLGGTVLLRSNLLTRMSGVSIGAGGGDGLPRASLPWLCRGHGDRCPGAAPFLRA